MPRRATKRIKRTNGAQLRTADMLLVLSVLTLVFTVIFIGLSVHERSGEGRTFTSALVFGDLGALALGLALSAGFLALSWVLRTLDSLSRALERLRSALGSQNEALPSPSEFSTPARTGQPSVLTPDTVRVIRELLEEIRDHSLLNEDQKHVRWSQLLQHRRIDLFDSVGEFIEQKRFVDAAHDIERFEEMYGRDAETTELRRKLDSQRRLAEKRDLNEALDAYVALKANREWGAAMKLGEELLNTYPQSLEIRNWLNQVAKDRDAETQAQRQQLLTEMAGFTADRSWRKALGAARRLVSEYPASAEADEIRSELETLEHNAEVETRQELESRIKNFVQDRKFGEALELAQDLIGRYPTSPQAQALRSQIPRLTERAKQQAGAMKAR